MWSQEVREALELVKTETESKLIKAVQEVEEFISEYRSYLIIGLIILGIIVILDLLAKWQGKREKKQIEEQIEEQMKEK